MLTFALTGCPSVPVNPLAPEVTGGEACQSLAQDLSRLDSACWFILITRTPTHEGLSVSVVAKMNVGQVSDVAVYARGRTLGEAVSAALRHVDATAPASFRAASSERMQTSMLAALHELDALNALCWETKLTKNTGWTVVAKARRSDELTTRTGYAEEETLGAALREAMAQVR